MSKDTIKVGLTGNRFSGKSRICKIFKQISIPIFDADVVLNFIINHDMITINLIRNNIGQHVFTECNSTSEGSILDIKKISKSDFDKIINCAEYELMQAWKKFLAKNEKSIYVIFKSSILFERNWSGTMDFNINVFCPKITRMERCREATKMSIMQIENYLKCEIDDLDKNREANFIIHNYEASNLMAGRDVVDQVNTIDNKIVESFFDLSKEIQYKQEQGRSLSKKLIL